ncbi:MAG: hypothetical protein NVS2B12_15770 [Ktedonobacteraceae bacterium]
MENSNAHRLIGTRLGTCELRQLIGTGGMGMVFLARQIRPVRDVAVKILRSGVGVQTEENQEFLARFRREADVVAQLDHINILPIYEYGEQNGLAYLVMPYLEGGSLRDLLAKRASLPAQEALVYIEQAASALEYAHNHRIIHRDIKPGNMLFHADGRLVLVDFGIARIIRDTNEGTQPTLTGTGQFLGSVDYMAPEMVSGRQPDHRADIYELGVVLFQMLSGRMPFQGTSTFLIAAQHLQNKPPSLCELNPAIPPQVDATVQKALAKDPAERYSRAGELALALRRALATSSYDIQSSPPPINTIPDTPTSLLPGTTLTAESEASKQHSGYVHPYNTPRPEPASLTGIPASTEPSTGGVGQFRLPGDTTSDAGPPFYLRQPSAPADRRQGRQRRFVLAGLIIFLLAAVFLFGIQAFRGGVGTRTQAPTPVLSMPTPVVTTGNIPTSTPASTPSTPGTPALSPAQQAQDTIQHYYDAVNQANYQAAYQLWGNDYQKTHPYNQFAAGYATTQHVDIVFHSIVAQADGSQMVIMTIYAQDKTSSGTKLSAFEGNYIVGQENGAWRLLNYHFEALKTPAAVAVISPP